jgi:hypothetical protein
MRMSARPERSRAHQGGAWSPVFAALVAAVGLVAVVGCGSSKPTYCSDRTSLENSVKGLTSLTASGGISGLKTQVKKVESNATALVSSAKSDFPGQTSAITSSVNALKSSVAALSSSVSAANIATVSKDAASVVSSVRNFTDATSSKCS